MSELMEAPLIRYRMATWMTGQWGLGQLIRGLRQVVPLVAHSYRSLHKYSTHIAKASKSRKSQGLETDPQIT